jgi:hypothetical protein
MKIQSGDYWSRVSFGKVLEVGGGSVVVQNEDGLEWSISRDIFDKEFTVADVYSSEGQDSRTRILKKILEYPRTAITIAFRKKVEPKTVIEAALAAADEGDLKKAIRNAMKGELRVMKGRHYGDFDVHGRLKVVDMEDPKRILKSVDPRTIEWAIVNGVKYEVK